MPVAASPITRAKASHFLLVFFFGAVSDAAPGCTSGIVPLFASRLPEFRCARPKGRGTKAGWNHMLGRKRWAADRSCDSQAKSFCECPHEKPATTRGQDAHRTHGRSSQPFQQAAE